MEIPVTLQSDRKGYFDRECPNENCLYTFKINMQDYNRAMIIKESDIFIYMLEYDEQSELGFNLEMVKAGLNDYLTGKKLAEGDAVYGIKAFRRYADDLERFPESYPDKR